MRATHPKMALCAVSPWPCGSCVGAFPKPQMNCALSVVVHILLVTSEDKLGTEPFWLKA